MLSIHNWKNDSSFRAALGIIRYFRAYFMADISDQFYQVKINTSKLLQGNEGIATAAEELKKDLAVSIDEY